MTLYRLQNFKATQTWVQWYFQDQQQFFTRSKWSLKSSLRSTLHQISRCIRPHRWICCFQGSQILQRLLLQLSKSFASAHAHSYVNLLSRDGLKHPSKQVSDCVARGFTILDASSAAILKSTLPNKKPVKLLWLHILTVKICFEKARMFD